MKTCIISSTRPQLIKMAPIIWKLQKEKEEFFIIHTGQHYDKNMSDSFIKDLKIPQPKYNLNINGGTDVDQICKTLPLIYNILKEEKPDNVMIHGDTNDTVSGSIACRKIGIKRLCHIEAGLRSHDDIPEELNRIIADHCSLYLFCPTKQNYDNLVRPHSEERIHHRNVFVTGNTLIDILQHYDKKGLIPKKTNNYILLTLHRQNNVDRHATLSRTLDQATLLAHGMGLKVKFCCHPRTLKRIEEFKIKLSKVIEILPPQRYLDFLTLEKNARLVISDSGGVIEETNYFKVPCVITRNKIEREEALTENAAMAHKQEDIVRIAKELLTRDRTQWTGQVFGEGQAAKRIYEVLYENKR